MFVPLYHNQQPIQYAVYEMGITLTFIIYMVIGSVVLDKENRNKPMYSPAIPSSELSNHGQIA